MTISAWHMDHTVFGHPDWGISQQASDRQFMRFPGDRGSGQYRELNERAPYQVSLSWDMHDDVFSDFVNVWGDPTKLCFGANWFTADLPLMHSQFDQQVDYLTNHLVKIKQRFALTVGVNGTTATQYGHTATVTHATGNVKPANFAGTFVAQMTFRTDNDSVLFTLGDGASIPNNELAINLYANAPGDEGLYSTLLWRSGQLRYTGPWWVQQPNAMAYIQANVGETIPIDIEFDTTPFQTYRCHFREPYRAEVIGVSHWRVSASVEVDVTPEFAT